MDFLLKLCYNLYIKKRRKNFMLKGFYGGKFLPFHRGHLHCILEASSKVDELHVILFHSSKEEKDIFQSETAFGNRYLTPKIREMVIRKELRNFEHIKIHSIDCSSIPTDLYLTSWEKEALEVEKVIGTFDAIFSSEPMYEPIFNKLYPKAQHILIDVDRRLVPISGTQLRDKKPMQAYEFLPRAYQEFVNRSVLIVGTESCGKTTLVQKLAKHFNTSYTLEFARDFCIEYGIGDPDISLYPLFLYGQKMAEFEASRTANRVYFCDTEAIVTNYYAMLYENTDLEIARAVAATQKYDLVIYLRPSNRWVDDGYRMHSQEEVRQENDRKLLELFEEHNVELNILEGTYQENYTNAIELVRKMMEQ